MSRLWPWSEGAPVTQEHNELEEKMCPNPGEESKVFDLQQRTAGDQESVQETAIRPRSRRAE
jgi:hypothetical protein